MGVANRGSAHHAICYRYWEAVNQVPRNTLLRKISATIIMITLKCDLKEVIILLGGIALNNFILIRYWYLSYKVLKRLTYNIVKKHMNQIKLYINIFSSFFILMCAFIQVIFMINIRYNFKNFFYKVTYTTYKKNYWSPVCFAYKFTNLFTWTKY